MIKKAKGLPGLLCFVILFAGIYWAAQTVIMPKTDDCTVIIDGFYALENNSLDAAFLGSSQMFCTVDAKMLTDEYGIVSYDFGASSQPLWITYYYMQELFRTQSPKVVMVEMCKAFERLEEFSEAAIAWNYASMPFSTRKFSSALKMFDGNYEKAALYTVSPLLTWHNRWESIEKKDFEYLLDFDKSNSARGFYTRSEVNPQELAYLQPDGNTYALPDENKDAIRQITRLAQENGAHLIFFKAPAADWTKAQSEAVKCFMAENEFEFFEMNDYLQQMNIDQTRDFMNANHLNRAGAVKATEFLAEYLLSLDESLGFPE